MSAISQVHEAAFRRANAQAGESFTWLHGATTVSFSATRNGIPFERGRDQEGVDRNPGDDTPGTLHALVSDFLAAALPRQGDVLTDAAGRGHRIIRIEYAPGLPVIVFHYSNSV
jgi:hypothetical protein